MVKLPASEIADNILSFYKECKKCGLVSTTEDIYVGITNNVVRRFAEHNVTSKYVCYEAYDDEQARIIEQVLIEKGKFDGGEGGGSTDCVYVYAFVKTANTRR